MRQIKSAPVGASLASRKLVATFLFVAIMVLWTAWGPQEALAAVYTYTPAAGGFSYWSTGANWNATPVSGADTELVFDGSIAVNDYNTNDIAGPFSLNRLDLRGAGSTSGAVLISIGGRTSSGNYLNFVNNGLTAPVVNLNAGGSNPLWYQIFSNVVLASDTTFQGSGTATFRVNGAIIGSGCLIKSGSSTLALTGNNTYTGDTKLSGGTLSFSRDALGSGHIVFDGGTLQWASGNSQDISGHGIAIASGTTAYLDTNGNDVSLGSVLSGSAGGLTKIGSGTLTLTNANLYDGTTTVLGGRLQLGDGATRNGSVSGNIVNNGTLVFANPHDQIFTESISGGGGLTKFGAGILTLTGANTFTGETVNDGKLVLGNSNALQNSCLSCAAGTVSFGTLTSAALGGLTGGQPMELTNDHSDPVSLRIGGALKNYSYQGTLSGTGSVTKVGANTQWFVGTNTYTGDTKVSGGVLVLRTIQNSTLDYDNYGGTVAFDGSGVLGGIKGRQNLSLADSRGYGVMLFVGGNNQSTEYSGILSNATYGGGSLWKDGTGTLTLTSTNTYTGDTWIRGGVLQLGNGMTNGSIQGTIINEASLIFNSVGEQTHSGLIGGSGTLTKIGPGRLMLASKGSGASNTYSGGTIIRGGTLNVSTDSVLGFAPVTPTTNITFGDNGTLEWGAAFDLNANRQISIASGATATFDIAEWYGTSPYGYSTPGYGTIRGAITGSGGVVKTGGGTLTLAGANTYAGSTTVAAGVLKAAQTNALPGYDTAGKISVGNGGTLAVNVGGAGQWTEADFDALSANVVFAAGSTIGVDTTNATSGFTYSGVISGDMGLMKLGDGGLTLTAAQTYRGPTTISGGFLVLAGGDNCLPATTAVTLGSSGSSYFGPGLSVVQRQTIASLSGGSWNFHPYTGVILNSASILTVGDSNSSIYLGGIHGNGQLVKQGIGTLTLNGVCDHTGGTVIAAGILEVGGFLAGPITNNSAIAFNVGASGTLTYGQSDVVYVSGSGTFAKTGGGKFTLGCPNTHFGDTAVRGGEFILNHVNVLQNSTLDYNNYGGTLSFGSLPAATLGGLKGSQDLSFGNTVLAVGNNNQSTAYNGALTGDGSLTKIGTGKLTLSGVNKYTGLTTVKDGVLELGVDAQSPILTGGGADIQGGKMVFDYTTGSTAADILGLLTESCHGGAWDVGQFRNSTASTTGLTLGWADDTMAKQVTVMATYAGDANLDGTTDATDLNTVLSFYNQTGMSWATGDFNGDGTTDATDLNTVLSFYNRSLSGIAGGGTNAVPEPTGLVLLATGGLVFGWFVVRQRRA